MNFFGSAVFLDAAAAVYFRDRYTRVENVRIGNDVLRLLVLDDRKIVSRMLFLDYHQPLDRGEIEGPVRQGRFARRVSRGIISVDAWNGEHDLAPFVDWAHFPSFDSYYDRLLSLHHGLMRDRERRGRALSSQIGKLTFTKDDRSADVSKLVRQWKGAQLLATGLPDYFKASQTSEFFDCLRAGGSLVTSTLRAGERLVSAWVGFIHEGSWSGWIFTYDQELKKYSPGHQLLIRMLEASFELGHREFDFSVGAQDYKMLYASHGRVLADIGTPSTARAAALSIRKCLLDRSPGVFAAALRMKWALASAMQRQSLSIPGGLS